MKKMKAVKAVAAAALFLMMTGCTGPEAPTTHTMTVRGSATVRSVTEGTRAAEAPSLTAEFASGAFMVDGKDRAPQMRLTEAGNTAISGAKPGDKVNNVEFEVEVSVSDTAELTAAPLYGFIFDEWELRDDCPEVTEDEIEDWMESNGISDKDPSFTMRSEWLEFFVPEYENGFHVDLSAEAVAAEENGEKAGSAERPFTLSEFKDAMKKYGEDEITLVLSGKGDGFTELFDVLSGMKELEEITLIAESGSDITIPAGIKIPAKMEAELKGFTVAEGFIFPEKAEVGFRDCTFLGDVEIVQKEVELRNCAFKGNLTVTVMEEFELKNSTVDGILSVNASAEAEEVEIEIRNVTVKELIFGSENLRKNAELRNVTEGK